MRPGLPVPGWLLRAWPSRVDDEQTDEKLAEMFLGLPGNSRGLENRKLQKRGSEAVRAFRGGGWVQAGRPSCTCQLLGA